MNRWDALEAIGAYLRAGLLGGPREVSQDVPWELIVEVASFHYVTPAIAHCMRGDSRVPSDVLEYFAAAETLNRDRNARLMSGLVRACAVMNALGIEPVLLKGAALIADGIYPDPALRALSDIDVLVPAERAGEADAALRRIGFYPDPAGAKTESGHHHLPMLHDPESGLGLELHTDAVIHDPTGIVATGWFCESARTATVEGARVRLPEATRNVAHLIFHGQILHRFDAEDRLQLRQLLDLALVRARYENEIDWGAIERRFAAAGQGSLLASYLLFADRLLGQSSPRLEHAPRADAWEKLQATESQDSFQIRLKRLQAENGALIRAIIAMKDARDGFFAEKVELHHRCVRLEAEAERLRIALANSETSRTAMEESRSWRVTAPLRAIAVSVRRWL